MNAFLAVLTVGVLGFVLLGLTREEIEHREED